MTFLQRLGSAIKLCRTQKNLTRLVLADRAGISVSYLSLLERGRRDPNIATIQRLCDALNMPLFLLFYLADRSSFEAIDPVLAEKLSYHALKLLGSEPT